MSTGLVLPEPAMAGAPGEHVGGDIPRADAVARCYQSRITQRRCAGCREVPKTVHIPTRYVGYYCGKCCPACSRETGCETTGLILHAEQKLERPRRELDPEYEDQRASQCGGPLGLQTNQHHAAPA
jgi:hypothetical protein